MSENDSLKAEIEVLLKRAQQGRETVQEFAWINLQHYRREALAVKTEENVRVARERLKTRLQALLAWAASSGRM